LIKIQIKMHQFTLAIHGGAGTILRTSMSAEKEADYRKGLSEALEAGEKILADGGSALDAVVAAVSSLEDCPLFNAGRGSVYNADGKQEMDASLMEGHHRQAGAVAGIRCIQNPIQLAKEVLLHSDHVMLMGEGAQRFAELRGIPTQDETWFHDAFRYAQWQAVKETDTFQLDHSKPDKFGTVGAVAKDIQGHLAAATSTGGMTNKKFGRVGDSPIIGCGNYAWDTTCAVSCTGSGEYFIRGVVAYDVSCLMEYKGLSLAEACRVVIQERLLALGGDGGLIAVDALGNVSLEFNTEGMYRGSVQQGMAPVIGIYKD
jgi:beta-aspartyl-peptidase (threonine type)